MQYLAAAGRLPTDTERPEDVAAWQHTLTFYEQALAQELLDPAVTGYNATDNYADLLLAGELDAAVLGSDDWLGLQAAGARLGYGPVPTLDGAQAGVLEGWMWVLVTDSSGRQALSARFLDWMLGPGRQSEFARSVAMLPSRNTALGDAGGHALSRLRPRTAGERRAAAGRRRRRRRNQQRPQRLPQRAQRRG